MPSSPSSFMVLPLFAVLAGCITIEVPPAEPVIEVVVQVPEADPVVPDVPVIPTVLDPGEELDMAGPTLREVSLFQVVEIPLWADGAEVFPFERTAPVVAGRAAVIRVYVDVPAGWSATDVEARVEVISEGVSTFYAEQGELLAASDVEDPSTGFVVHLPAEAIEEGATYRVTLWRVGEPIPSARFPALAPANLAPIETGPIKIHLVPFELNGFVPDTSAAIVEGYRQAVFAVYPTPEVIITVGDLVPDSGESDLGNLNVEVGIIQETYDDAPWDVYYYGMATGVATRAEFSGITGSSEVGFGNRARFAIGAAFGDQKAEDTLIHELGHLHGLAHAPCGNVENPAVFPYQNGAIGVEGYDVRTGEFIASDASDMMGYCYPRWISDHNYALVADWVQMSQLW